MNKIERNLAGGVAATADKLAKKQAQGWVGSKGIFASHKRRSAAERLAKSAARSQKDQEFRLGRKKG
jgi:hypothetical protein